MPHLPVICSQQLQQKIQDALDVLVSHVHEARAKRLGCHLAHRSNNLKTGKCHLNNNHGIQSPHLLCDVVSKSVESKN